MIFNFALLCLWRIPLSLSFCNFHFPLLPFVFVLVRICLFLYLCICRRKHVSPKGAVTPTYHHQTNSSQRPDQPTSTNTSTSTTSTTYQNINIHHQHINIDNTSCKEQFQVWGSTLDRFHLLSQLAVAHSFIWILFILDQFGPIWKVFTPAAAFKLPSGMAGWWNVGS